MNKSLNVALVAMSVLLISMTTTQANGTDATPSFAQKAASFSKSSVKYLASTAGVKDMLGAYCLGMALTALHEFGHAAMAKMFYGAPIDITLGSTPSQSTLNVSLGGGFKLGGFNPATGYARYSPQRNAHPLKEATLSLAGPLLSAACSFAVYKVLKKYPQWYLCKAAAGFGVFNQTLGAAGIYGSLFSYNHDYARAARAVSEYMNS